MVADRCVSLLLYTEQVLGVVAMDINKLMSSSLKGVGMTKEQWGCAGCA